jgi:branched-chain amino acid transport system permease protein
MLVVGGPTTVTGAVGGSFAVSLLMEGARRLEGALHGASLGGLEIGGVFGLQEVTLGILILLVMYRRRDGLLARAELDEVALRWRRRRAGGSGGMAFAGNPGDAGGDAT